MSTFCWPNVSSHMHVKSSHWIQTKLCSDLEPFVKSSAPNELYSKLLVLLRYRLEAQKHMWYLVSPLEGNQSLLLQHPWVAAAVMLCTTADTKVLHKQQNYIHLNLRTNSALQIHQLCTAFCSRCAVCFLHVIQIHSTLNNPSDFKINALIFSFLL